MFVVLILIGKIDGGLWITLPSAQDGCGSLQSDSYFWDTQDFSGYSFNEPVDTYARNSLAVPKGGYYFYYDSLDGPFYYSDVRQYFCTGYIDQMPVGSYCFYQNTQNGNSYSLFINKIII